MCWISFKEPKLHRAQRIIPVYKVLYICENKNKIVFISPYRRVEYNLGRMHCSYFEGIKTPCLHGVPYSVHYGIHSYMSNMVVLNKGQYLWRYNFITARFTRNCIRLCALFPNQIVVKGYIPKGGLYYVNRCGEVVSDTLVLRKEGYDWRFNKIVL